MDNELVKINVKTLQNYNSPCPFVYSAKFYFVNILSFSFIPAIQVLSLLPFYPFFEFSDIIKIATASAVSAVVL